MTNAGVLFTQTILYPSKENTDWGDQFHTRNYFREYEVEKRPAIERSFSVTNFSILGAESWLTDDHERKTDVENHPNLIKYCRALARSKGDYLFMLDTRITNSLQSIIQSNEKLPWTERFFIAKQLADALSFLHSRSITHGDIKPKNVFLTKSKEIKIFKHSIAQPWEQFYRLIDLYWAPERFSIEYQFENKWNLKAYTDVYSYAMIIYELITRKKIYQDADRPPVIVVTRIQMGIRPNLELVLDVGDSLKPGSIDFKIYELLRQTMEECWDKNPLDRPSMQEVYLRFANFQKQELPKQIVEKNTTESIPGSQHPLTRTPRHCFQAVVYIPLREIEVTVTDKLLHKLLQKIFPKQTSQSCKLMSKEPKQQLKTSHKFVSKTEAWVGSNGAKLTVGGCIVDIPPGALSEDVKIELTASYGNKDKKIELTPELDCKPDGLQFNKPVTISLPTCYKAKTNIPVNIKTSEDTNTWNTLESANHSRDKMIAFETNHFSFFKAFPTDKHTLEQNGMMFAVSKSLHKTNVNEVNEYLQQRANQQVCNEKYVSDNQGKSAVKKVPSNTVSKVIGPKGGKLESNGCSLLIPPNALSEEVTITITPYLNSKLDIAPYIKCCPSGLKFQKNVTITLPICKDKNNMEQITVKYCNVGSTWRTLTKSPSCTDANICFQTNHFTRFGVDLQDPHDSQSLDKEKIAKFAVRRSASHHLNRILLTCFFADNLEIIRESDEFRHLLSVHHREFEMRNEDDPVKMTITCDNNQAQSKEDSICTRRLALLHYMITGSDERRTDFNLQSNTLHTMFEGEFYIPELGPTNARNTDRVDPELLQISRRIPNKMWDEFARRKLDIDDTAIGNSMTDNHTAEEHRRFILICWNEHDGHDAIELQQLINQFWEEA